MKKRFLLLATIVSLSIASHAQVEKKDWLLGGSFSFTTGNSSSSAVISGASTVTSSNSNINPELGLAVSKNSILGIRGGLSINTYKGKAGGKSTYTTWAAGAFWKRLFPINERVGWFSDVEVGYSRLINDYASGYNYEMAGFSAGVAPGFYYQPSRRILLNANVGGLSYTYSKNGTNKNSAFDVNLLNAYTFGVSFIINKDKQM
ncbi:MAG: hypothetical protein JST39_18400 [Bacteroidetes bacterium]|nr:hypothetical protein [Bacteroidota bacterium]